MPFQLQSACFTAEIEGTQGVGSVEVSVYRTGRGRYEADCYISGLHGPSRYMGGHDATLNRNFEDWKEALKVAAKAAVFKVNNGQLRFIGPWKQERASHVEVDKDGKEVKVKKKTPYGDSYETSNYKDDIEVDIVLPQSEGEVQPNKIKVPASASQGLKNFKSTRYEDNTPK